MLKSGAKRFKVRFSSLSMLWSRADAERLLPVRTVLIIGRFDERWYVVFICDILSKPIFL